MRNRRIHGDYRRDRGFASKGGLGEGAGRGRSGSVLYRCRPAHPRKGKPLCVRQRTSAGPALFCLEVSHPPLKSRLIRVVIFPIAEVWNEVLSNLAGGTDFNGNDTFT
jgi:hypothetical protein